MSLKLCYIWVEKYRNFENFGVNLSSTEKFDYNHRTGLITYETIATLPKNFFENDRVLDVVGIIGKNGTGKSNLLELACSLLKGGTTAVNTNFLIIIIKDGRIECHTSPDLTHILRWDVPIDIFPYRRVIEPLKVIYFSNVYDEREHYFDSRISNLSGNYRYKRNRYASKKTSDFVKQLQFVRSAYMNAAELPFPQEIAVSIKKLNSSQTSKKPSFLSAELADKFESLLKLYYKNLNTLEPSKDTFYYHILFLQILDLINIFQSEITHSRNHSDFQNITEDLIRKIEKTDRIYKRNFDFEKSWEEWVMRCSDILRLFDDGSSDKEKKQLVENLKSFNNNIALLNEFNEFIDSSLINIQIEGKRGSKQAKYILKFKQHTNKLEERFYNYFDRDIKFSLNWLGLSSGHKAYLDFFSLLWFELKSIKTENVIIFIDEGDLYLHPKWQADFFYKVITLIPQFREVNFQFVLTSHSPFLVSDLPTENLVFLSSYEDEKVEVLDRPEVKTFGGNLGDLYINAFFMEGALVSRFAANKIQEVVDKINHKEPRLTINDRKLIDLIGEDLIRLQIEKLIDGSNRG